MSPRRDLCDVAAPWAAEETPEDDAPHSPLIVTSIHFPQHNGEHDPETGPPDPCPVPGGDHSNSSRSGKGRSWRLWCVKRLVLAAVGVLFLGGVLGFVAGFFLAPRCLSCPSKWTRSEDKCFFVSQETSTWGSSQQSCRSQGGTLPTMDDEMKQEFKTLHDLTGDYWVGLRKDAHSGEWRQLNGSMWTDPIEYDGPQMGCAVIDSKWKIVALDCSTPRRWICVKSLRQDH